MPKEYIKLPPLEVEPALYRALTAYAKQVNVPRSRVIRDILRTFLGPMVSSLGAEALTPEQLLATRDPD